jgi:dTDP-glucose pyrophosphorylase
VLVDDVSRCVVPEAATVKSVVENLTSSGLRLSLVVGPDGALVGIVSDGDIRRGLLAGEGLESPASAVMNRSFAFAPSETPVSELKRVVRSREVTHLPLVDQDGKLAGLFIDQPDERGTGRDNTVVIMAGGVGLRLRPLTEKTPKPMLPVGGKPMVQHTIEALRSEGFANFVLAINYLGDQIESHFGDGSDFGVDISYVREAQPLGTGGALSLLEGSFQSPILVVNGDVMLSAKISEMLDFHNQSGGELTVGVKLLETQIPYGVVDVDGSRILGIKEKPVYRDFVNAGVYVLNAGLLGKVPHDEKFDMTDLLAKVIETSTATAFPLHESWIDLGRHEDLLRAREEHDEV